MVLRRCFLVFLSVFAAVCVLHFAADLRSVQAQPSAPTQPKHFDPVSAQEKRIFDEIIRQSYGDDPAKSAKARKILSRQLVRGAPRVAAAGPVAALAVGAVGVWAVVGLQLYYLPCWECTPKEIQMNTEMRVPEGAVVAVKTGSNSQTITLLTHASAHRDMTSGDTSVTQRIMWFAKSVDRRADNWYFAINATGIGESTHFSYPPRTARLEYPYPKDGGAVYNSPTTPVSKGLLSKTEMLPGYKGRVVWGAYQDGQTQIKLVEVCAAGASCATPLTPPIVEVGNAGASGAPSENMTMTPTESNQWINNVVADPETPGVVDPMDVPETQPDPGWDPNKDPFNPLFDPFAEPEGDPDGDGIPNRSDEDPEGDGDADGDGDSNEHPVIAPNPDPAQDPEGDGDADGDGDPNETTPTPSPAPLPADDPNADPDEDGIPNETDPDQDGDGIPNESDPDPSTPTDPGDLPEDHPYGDPDGDGIPNQDDADDDGDGREDGTDDQPLMPFWSPRADPDFDGTPNEDDKNDDGDPAEDWEDDNPWNPEAPSNPDQDADEDGVPDWSDPWPGNPYAPTDPSRDEDADQIPDYKDPEPADPLVPWSPSEFRPDRQTSPPNYPDSPWSPSDAPWSPTSPGTPNMPNAPTNPNVPNTPSTPEMPGDPSTGTANPPPTRTDVPDDPNTEASPDEPPPPSGPLFVCPAELKPSFVLPPVDFEEKFPFSLILGAKNVLGQLVTTPKAPVFDLPMLGPQDLSRFDGVMSMMRTVWLVILGGILMPIMFYRLIRGSDE